ncbi:MAG: AbrB/MazE/SpoVT family DNA-binding domain-containing protein [Myxococcales bacterium]|nr:AbrB/MazE/SpoVT family DNA-binding domain-containing protein [Myxococcales bacterium]
MKNAGKQIELKVVAIGNSRGVRLPKTLLDRYSLRDKVLVELREEGLLLKGKRESRLSWAETYKKMAGEREDWSDLDATLSDGLEADA